MIPAIIVIGIIVFAIIFWAIVTQRKLVVLDENINDAMNQIGIQISNSLDALTAVLDLIKAYYSDGSESLIGTIKTKRSDITANSSPEDVLVQKGIITEVISRIIIISEKYPELKENPSYTKTMDAVETYENMVRTSRLIYNVSVMKLNREIRMFPISVIAHLLKFPGRNYLIE